MEVNPKTVYMREWRKTHPQASMLANRRAHCLRKERGLTDKERKDRIASVISWQKKFPEKVNAKQKVYYAVKTGKLKKESCWCGEKEVQAHHFDYSKPLEVEWVCQRHHEVADKVRQMSEETNR